MLSNTTSWTEICTDDQYCAALSQIQGEVYTIDLNQPC